MDYFIFSPAWTLAPVYIASVYIPFIILYEALASEVQKTVAENHAADDWDGLLKVTSLLEKVSFVLIMFCLL